MKGQRPIAAATAYDAVTAKFADDAGVDVLLVGDSMGNVILGFENTVPVTLDMIAHHTAAVARAKPQALIAADVPFAEAHYGFERVLAACQRLLQQAGAEAVKIEAGADMADQIARLVDAGVPVWGHVGLKPQQVYSLGRYKKFGATPEEADQILTDGAALEKAGAFALLVEMIESNVAEQLTAASKIPVIGIGAGPSCDGQILVCNDLLGLTRDRVPSFVRAFANAAEQYQRGFADYVAAVREKKFP